MIDYKKYKAVLEIISRTHNASEQTSVKDSIFETTEQKASAICDLFDMEKVNTHQLAPYYQSSNCTSAISSLWVNATR